MCLSIFCLFIGILCDSVAEAKITLVALSFPMPPHKYIDWTIRQYNLFVVICMLDRFKFVSLVASLEYQKSSACTWPLGVSLKYRHNEKNTRILLQYRGIEERKLDLPTCVLKQYCSWGFMGIFHRASKALPSVHCWCKSECWAINFWKHLCNHSHLSCGFYIEWVLVANNSQNCDHSLFSGCPCINSQPLAGTTRWHEPDWKNARNPYARCWCVIGRKAGVMRRSTMNNNRDLFYVIALIPHQLPGKVHPCLRHCQQIVTMWPLKVRKYKCIK